MAQSSSPTAIKMNAMAAPFTYPDKDSAKQQPGSSGADFGRLMEIVYAKEPPSDTVELQGLLYRRNITDRQLLRAAARAAYELTEDCSKIFRREEIYDNRVFDLWFLQAAEVVEEVANLEIHAFRGHWLGEIDRERCCKAILATVDTRHAARSLRIEIDREKRTQRKRGKRGARKTAKSHRQEKSGNLHVQEGSRTTFTRHDQLGGKQLDPSNQQPLQKPAHDLSTLPSFQHQSEEMAEPIQTNSKSLQEQLSDLISSPNLSHKDLPHLHQLVFSSTLSAETLLDASVQAVDHLNGCMNKYRKYTESSIFWHVKGRIAAVNTSVKELQQKDADEKWEVKDKEQCRNAVMKAAVLRMEVVQMVRDHLSETVQEAQKKRVAGEALLNATE